MTATPEWLMQYFSSTDLFKYVDIEKIEVFSVNKKQFVKATLRKEEEVQSILKNKNKLAKETKYTHIYIEQQRTREELREFHKRRLEKKSRQSSPSYARTMTLPGSQGNIYQQNYFNDPKYTPVYSLNFGRPAIPPRPGRHY